MFVNRSNTPAKVPSFRRRRGRLLEIEKTQNHTPGKMEVEIVYNEHGI